MKTRARCAAHAGTSRTHSIAARASRSSSDGGLREDGLASWAEGVNRPCTLWTWGARVLVPARIVVPSMEWLSDLRVNQWVMRFPEDDALVQQHRLLLDATAAFDGRRLTPGISPYRADCACCWFAVIRRCIDIQDDDLKTLSTHYSKGMMSLMRRCVRSASLHAHPSMDRHATVAAGL
jgi:hypothetical protein